MSLYLGMFIGCSTFDRHDTNSEGYYEEHLRKIKIHEDYSTTLISTYSYELTGDKQRLLSNLRENLKKHDVVIKYRKSEEMMDKISEVSKYSVPLFLKFIQTFLGLYKSKDEKIESLYEKIDYNFDNTHSRDRAKLFLDIFKQK